MITDSNPFVYSRPIAPDEIIDRDEETAKLLRWAVGGHYVRLYAPRKFGKTSLLGRVLRDGEREEGLIPIMVDLYGVLSIADIAVRIERAYAKELKGAVRTRIDQFLQSTGLGLSLGAFGISAKLQLDPRVDPLPALHSLLDLPLRLGESGWHRALVVFDEFQDIVRVGYMDALCAAISGIRARSPRTLLRLRARDDAAALRGQGAAAVRRRGADAPALAPRRGDRRLRERAVPRLDRAAGEGFNPLLRTAKGHPQRAIYLAHRLWEEVPEGETATFEHWQRAHATALAELEPEFDAHWRSFGTSEQKALRAVLAGEGSPLRAAVLPQLEVEKTTIHNAVQRLAATAEVELADRKYTIVDPLFAEWIDSLRAS